VNEGLGMDPNPSSFLPLIFVLHNSTNLSSTICLTIVLPYGLVSYHPLLTVPTLHKHKLASPPSIRQQSNNPLVIAVDGTYLTMKESFCKEGYSGNKNGNQ
jgi:hypothetical protein